MKKQAEIAGQLFAQGFNCAQATAGAFDADTGVDRSILLRMATGFGGGIAGRRETCGAVTGMLMAAGLAMGFDSAVSFEEKEQFKAYMAELIQRFEAQFGCSGCSALLERQPPEEERRAYCGRLVSAAAAILAEELEQ